MISHKTTIIIGIVVILKQVLSLITIEETYLTKKKVLAKVYIILTYAVNVFFAILSINSVFINKTASLMLTVMNLIYIINYFRSSEITYN